MDRYKKITAAAVLGFAAVMAFGTFLSRGKKVSADEARTLTDFPKASLSAMFDGSFPEQAEKHFTDHFMLRSKWLSFESDIQPRIGERIVNGVYIGEDRLLNCGISDRIPDPSAAERINDFAAGYDGTVYIAAVPSSSGVYDDELPYHLHGDSEAQQISGFYDSLSGSVRKIDAYNILRMLRDNYIYYRSDTKWTSYGAYCVYRTVIQKLGFLPTTYDKYTILHVSDNFRGNLYNRTLYKDIMPDLLDIYEYPDGAQVTACMASDGEGHTVESSLYDMDMLETSDMYRMYLGKEVPVLDIETSLNNQRKLLVIKDSYADCFIPFLTQHFSRITVVSPEHMKGVLSDNVDVSDYEQTLILFGIENIGNTGFFSGISS